MKTFVLVVSLLFFHALALGAEAPGDRAILVTGASSGIGLRIAEVLAAEGYFVYAGARKTRDIEALSARPNMLGVRLDVTRDEDIEAAVALVRSEGRGLYGLVNNAGVFLFDPLIEVSEDDLQFIMDVNVFGPYRVTRAFAPLIIESGGRIISTGSIASAYAGRLLGPYSMTKAALGSFTEALHAEMRKFGVAVAIVDPGNFRSNIMRNAKERLQELDRGERESLFRDEIQAVANFTQPDRSHHADPKPVAEVVTRFFSSDKPRLRYMVTPNAREAAMAVRGSLRRTVQLNGDQPYALDRDDLVALLDELLAAETTP